MAGHRFLCLTMLSLSIIGCSNDHKGETLVYCPSPEKVAYAVSQDLNFITVDIGKWKIETINKPNKIKFQKASYLAGWPACFYGPKGEGPAIQLSPLVEPELFPAWKGTTGQANQWNAPNCTSSIKDCPWNAVPYNSSATPEMP